MASDITVKQVWSYVMRYVKSYPVSMGVLFLVAFVSAADVSLRPYVIKLILNRLTDNTQVDVLHYLAVPMMAYVFLHFLLGTSHRIYDYFVEIKMITHMRAHIVDDALDMLVDKSHSFYQNNFSGSLGSKVNDLATTVPYIIQKSLYHFLLQGCALIIAMVTLGSVSILFAFFMCVWALLFIISSLFFAKHLVYYSARWSECGAVIIGNMVDVLSNMLSVRLFAAKSQEKKMWQLLHRDAMRAEKKMAWTYCIMWALYGYSFTLLQVFNFYMLCKGRQEGWITVGDFALVLVINMAIANSIWKIAEEFTQFSKSYGRIAQALRVLLSPSKMVDAQDAKQLVVSRGEIAFQNVHFCYEGSEPLFQNLSVTIAAGQKVGLVGYSGGGKTTFVNLILRLYDVADGSIVIDGQNIREVTQDSLHYHIGMIPQDPSLFHRTIMENIRYGCAHATDEQVIEAAKKAHAHLFISTLPEGYASLVGERGVKLSGGQRQRIAIARAILKNAPILILDEATSQLDSVTEKDIQDSLWALMQDKTTLVIAHRLSTLLHMDRILVFDKGEIVEDGAHAELLSKDGLYKTLWNAQVGGFLPDQSNEIDN